MIEDEWISIAMMLKIGFRGSLVFDNITCTMLLVMLLTVRYADNSRRELRFYCFAIRNHLPGTMCSRLYWTNITRSFQLINNMIRLMAQDGNQLGCNCSKVLWKSLPDRFNLSLIKLTTRKYPHPRIFAPAVSGGPNNGTIRTGWPRSKVEVPDHPGTYGNTCPL